MKASCFLLLLCLLRTKAKLRSKRINLLSQGHMAAAVRDSILVSLMKNRSVDSRRRLCTWKLMVLAFICAGELGLGPLCFPTHHLADTRGRHSLYGPVSLKALVVNYLPHDEMINSLCSFMFPWWRLPAVTWKEGKEF